MSLAVFFLLTACGGVDEPTERPNVNEESTAEEEGKDSFNYQQFYLTSMERSRSDESIDYSYGIDLLANSITVRTASSIIGIDGQEVFPEPQQLIDYERKDDGTITFSFEEQFYTEEGTVVEVKTVTFNRLSNSVYALEDGTQYEFSEEEKE